MMLDFRGRTVIVTGGGSGIGARASRLFATQGATVYIADLDGNAAQGVADAVIAEGGAAEPLQLDVTDFDACTRACDVVAGAHGRIDVLVTSAGWAETHPFIEESPDYWRRVVDVNFFGTVHACHAALGHMVRAGYGRIVTVGSDAGRVGSIGQAVYAGTKGAIVSFVKSIAREAGRSGVVANCVSPGIIDTPLVRLQDEAIIQKMVRQATLKRLGSVEEVGSAILYLASEEAAFVTGQVLSVSGGLTMAG